MPPPFPTRRSAVLVGDHRLHPAHHMIVEDAVEETHLQRRVEIGGDQARLGHQMVEIFDDDRRFEISRAIMDEQRKLPDRPVRSEEHTSELQSLMRISYAVFCLKKKTNTQNT